MQRVYHSFRRQSGVWYAFATYDDLDNRILELVVVSEDGTEERYTLVDKNVLGYVAIGQLTDGTIAAVATLIDENDIQTGVACKFDLEKKKVLKTATTECIPGARMRVTDDGLIAYYKPEARIIHSYLKINNDFTEINVVQPRLLSEGTHFIDNCFITGDHIIYIGLDEFQGEWCNYGTNKMLITMTDMDGNTVATNNAMLPIDNAYYLGAVENDDGSVIIAYAVVDPDTSKTTLHFLVLDENFKLRSIINSDQPLQKLWTIFYKSEFKNIADGYFLSYDYYRWYDPFNAVGGTFNTETYQQGLLIDKSLEVKSSFDVAYIATAAEIGSTGNRFIVGDEYGYYTVNAELSEESKRFELYSDKYTVDNDAQTIIDIPDGTTVENLLKYIYGSEECSYEIRYTHYKLDENIDLDEVLSCKYELLIYDPDKTSAVVYTFPEMSAGENDQYNLLKDNVIYNYTATEPNFTVPEFVEYFTTESSYNVDMSCVTSLTASCETVIFQNYYNVEELNLLPGCKRIIGFSYCHNLKKVVIPDTVTSIEFGSFNYCEKLSEIVIPVSVTRIAGNTFEGLTSPDLKITYLGTKEQWDKIDKRNFSFDENGEKYGFWDIKEEYGDKFVFAGTSNVYERAPEYAVAGAMLSADKSTVSFKVNKSLFEKYGYSNPYLEVVFNAQTRFITDYSVDGNYYVFELDCAENTPSRDEIYVTLHSYNRGVLKSTDVKTYYLSALAETSCQHETVETVGAVDPSCTAAGYTGDTVCAICGEICELGHSVPAYGHSYSSVVTDPTYIAQGYTTHTCETCGDSYTDSYTDMLEPVPGDINGDGSVNSKDSNLIKRMILGIYVPDEAGTRAADINCDGVINSKDSNLIKRIIAAG